MWRGTAARRQADAVADVRVRRAMTMLVDRKRLIDQVMLGYAVEATGPFNPLSKQYNSEVKAWAYDANGAVALLKEAGFADRDGDGVIEAPMGRSLVQADLPFWKRELREDGAVHEGCVCPGGDLLIPDTGLVGAGGAAEQKNFEAMSLGWTAGIESDISRCSTEPDIGGRQLHELPFRSAGQGPGQHAADGR
ncbi:MAG: ABC transporter substrate-binding protein [Thermomicrobiales bacterium]